jgi:tetratricopeptide (TPR) repeat protein
MKGFSMGLFNKIKKKKNNNEPSKDVEQIFKKLSNLEKPKVMVDKAISFRELGQYEKAINILLDVLKNYQEYKPAKTVLGVTFAQKGDIKKAEMLFEKIIAQHKNDKDFLLTDVYANLGNIRWKHYKDIKGALKYFELALNAPKLSGMDDNTYEIIKSGVNKDLCWLYFEQKDLTNAKMHAARRFKIVRDCSVASKVLGICLLEEFSVDYNNFEFVMKDIEPTNLIIASECFKICLNHDKEDYVALMSLALASVYLSTCRAIADNSTLYENSRSNLSQCLNNLKYYAQKSEIAEKCRQEFENKMRKFSDSLEALKSN